MTDHSLKDHLDPHKAMRALQSQVVKSFALSDTQIRVGFLTPHSCKEFLPTRREIDAKTFDPERGDVFEQRLSVWLQQYFTEKDITVSHRDVTFLPLVRNGRQEWVPVATVTLSGASKHKFEALMAGYDDVLPDVRPNLEEPDTDREIAARLIERVQGEPEPQSLGLKVTFSIPQGTAGRFTERLVERYGKRSQIQTTPATDNTEIIESEDDFGEKKTMVLNKGMVKLGATLTGQAAELFLADYRDIKPQRG